jgi:hypothetical protein
MNLVIEQIVKAKREKRLISICLKNIDWNRRIIGYVKDGAPAKHIRLEIRDEYGQKKDTKNIPLAAIKCVEIGGLYADDLEILIEDGFFKTKGPAENVVRKSHQWFKKLSELSKAKILCTFFFKEDYSMGVVTDVNEQEFSINNIGYEGKTDGVSVYDLKKLTRVRFGSNFENRIDFLSKRKKSR